MTGKCYSCWCSFGLFNKEHGCSNCGYSFCKKCLTKKFVIHKTDGQECLVCNKCFDILSKNKSSVPSLDFQPPDILAKRIAEAEVSAGNRKKKAIELNKKREIKNKDEELMARLANLKDPLQGAPESRIAPSEEEIESRLQNIKGTSLSGAKSVEPQVLKKDEVDQLLDEILDEVYLDNRLSCGGSFQSEDGVNQEQTPKDAACVDELIKQVVDEVKLEDKAFLEKSQKDQKLQERFENLKEEIKGEIQGGVVSNIVNDLKKKWEAAEKKNETNSTPWCCICNEDTEFQCLECDGDFYCTRCFKMDHECHLDEKHTLLPIKKS